MEKSINDKEQCVQTDVMQSVLKASDLRIGNLIAFGKQCCKVYEIQENCFYVIGEKERSFKNTSFELEPIKLNENWLLNFGFKRFPWGLVKDNLLFKDDLKCSYLILQVGNGFEVKIKYLHELQNLYFSLTQRELTVA